MICVLCSLFLNVGLVILQTSKCSAFSYAYNRPNAPLYKYDQDQNFMPIKQELFGLNQPFQITDTAYKLCII